MNRDCGCQHHARNILVDKFKVKVNGQTKFFPFDDYEANVQNALELLFSQEGIEKIISLLENYKDLDELILELELMRDNFLEDEEFKQKILALIREIILGDSDLNDKLIEEYEIDGICYNPRALEDNEPLYYQSFFTEQKVYQVNGESIVYPYEIDIRYISFPNFSGESKITQDDFELAEKIYNKFNTVENGNTIYDKSESELNTLLDEIIVGASSNPIHITNTWKNRIKEKIEKRKQFIEYDVNLIGEFLERLSSQDEEKRKIPWASFINDEGSATDISSGLITPSNPYIELENNEESWKRFLIYKNPFTVYGMPNVEQTPATVSTDSSLKLSGQSVQVANARDYGLLLAISSNHGVGNKDKKTIWSEYINAKDAARVDTFSVEVGAHSFNGVYTGGAGTAENWKKYYFDNNIKNVKDLYDIRLEDEIKIKTLTQNEYDNLEEKSDKILYVIVEGN